MQVLFMIIDLAADAFSFLLPLAAMPGQRQRRFLFAKYNTDTGC